MENRAEWTAEIQMRTGITVDCTVTPVHNGATIVRFTQSEFPSKFHRDGTDQAPEPGCSRSGARPLWRHDTDRPISDFQIARRNRNFRTAIGNIYCARAMSFCWKARSAAGKTHFARNLIQSLMAEPEDVPSPTFTLVQAYDTPSGEIWHCDLYRLSAAEEVDELGLTEAFDTAICLVEWPDKLGPLAPRGALTLTFETDPNNTRIPPCDPVLDCLRNGWKNWRELHDEQDGPGRGPDCTNTLGRGNTYATCRRCLEPAI